jgi:eukaryotic-like serine/threonine-protein kinase
LFCPIAVHLARISDFYLRDNSLSPSISESFVKVTELEYQSLPNDLQVEILQRCESFAETWQLDSLSQVDAIIRQPLPETQMAEETVAEDAVTMESVLLYELLRIDVRQRVDSGTPPDRTLYDKNFPDDTAVVESVFAQLKSGTLSSLELSTLEGGTSQTEQQTMSESQMVDSRTPDHKVIDRLIRPDASTDVSPDNTGTIAESLLATDAQTFAESELATQEQTDARKRLKASTIPHQLGDYDLLNKLGEGGMGVVYLATQKSANRKVALKIIRPDRLGGLSEGRNKKAVDRFRTEAHAAAKIQHDHLVTVYEVGFENDCHFFSMQYVEGASLSEKLREGPVDPKQAVAWIEPTCRAVHAVHENGILHRDLKPQNIMLEEATGKTLVADFGLAKLADSDVEMTHTGEAMGTPPYMSPEQFRDAASVTSSTDVYALGATLYHLMSGRPPFQAATTAQTMRQVMDKEPVALRQLNPSVDKDVETICMKCLEKEPAKRYESAAQLADELKRYLEGKPILARPISRLERCVRWCRRNPLVAAFAGIAATSIVVTLASLAVSNVRIEASRERAEVSFQDALEAVNDFFTRVSEDRLLNEPGMQGLRKELLVRADEYYKRLLKRREDDETISVELAATHYRLGLIVEQLYPNELDKALASFELARASQKEILENSDQSAVFAARRALSLTENALGRAYAQKGDSQQKANSHFRASLDLREQLIDSAKSDEEKIEATRLWANTMMNRGIIQRRDGNLAAAKSTYELAQERRTQVLKLDPKTRRLRRDLAKGCLNLANVLIDQSTALADVAEISRQLKQAISWLESLLKEKPADLQDKYLLMLCHRMLGDLHAKLAEGDPQERGFSIDHYTKAELAIRDLANRNPDIVSYRLELARLLMNLGLMLAQDGKYAQALEQFLAAQELLQAIKNSAKSSEAEPVNVDKDLNETSEKIRVLRGLVDR